GRLVNGAGRQILGTIVLRGFRRCFTDQQLGPLKIGDQLDFRRSDRKRMLSGQHRSGGNRHNQTEHSCDRKASHAHGGKSLPKRSYWREYGAAERMPHETGGIPVWTGTTLLCPTAPFAATIERPGR